MMMDDAGLAAIARLMAEVARTEIMPRFGRLGPGDLRTKSGPLDPVTVADEAAERALIAGLAGLFPDVGVVGEEGVAADRGLLDRVGEAAPVFVVDPIDGTQNFASGLPLFGTMIALIENGTILAGLIHDPLRGDTVVARRGGGARLLVDGEAARPIAVADPTPIGESIASVSWQYMAEPERRTVLGNITRFGQVPNFRCAAATYRAIATGQMHAALSRRTLPWDHAPGAIIVAEAGGHVATPEGRDWHPADFRGGVLAATDPESWAAYRDTLFG